MSIAWKTFNKTSYQNHSPFKSFIFYLPHTKIWLFILTLYWYCLCWYGADQFHLYFDNDATKDMQAVSYEAAQGLFYFISLKRDINIKIEWAALGQGILGSSSFPYGCQDELRNIFIILPPALYVQKYGENGNCRSYNGNVFYHMTIQLNSDPSVRFYWQNNVTKIQSNEYDALTTIRHEMVHGLGQKSSIASVDGMSTLVPMGYLYDWIIFSANGAWPDMNSGIPLQNPTFKNGYRLDSSLLFPCNHSFPLNVDSIDFANGVPVAHNAHEGLMNFKLSKGQQRSALSMYDIEMLSTLGYTTKNCDHPDMSTPCAFCRMTDNCHISASEPILSFFFNLY